MKGVLDRIEKGIAVILVEEKGEQFTISEDELPVGSKEGTWFQLVHDGNNYQILHIDEKKTTETTKLASQLSQKLRAHKKQSKFKRK